MTYTCSYYTITPHVFRGRTFEDYDSASEAADLFNLATLENLEARPELDGYQEDAPHRVRVCYVRTIDAGQDRKTFDTIGWLRGHA
jgi:hypothetical protein